MTTESLKDEGKVPEDRERLMMLVIIGASTEIDCLTRDVEMGSSSHCLVDDCRKLGNFVDVNGAEFGEF